MSNGCFDRPPFERLIPLPAVYTISIEGHHVLCDAEQMISFVFSKECEYSKSKLGQVDEGCFDGNKPCKWRHE
jgi:hypothetical protein